MRDSRFAEDRREVSARSVTARSAAGVTRRRFLALTARAVGARMRPVGAEPLGAPWYGLPFSDSHPPILHGSAGEVLVALASAVEALDTEVMAWRSRHGEWWLANR